MYKNHRINEINASHLKKIKNFISENFSSNIRNQLTLLFTDDVQRLEISRIEVIPELRDEIRFIPKMCSKYQIPGCNTYKSTLSTIEKTVGLLPQRFRTICKTKPNIPRAA
jgi:hypothetical protein